MNANKIIGYFKARREVTRPIMTGGRSNVRPPLEIQPNDFQDPVRYGHTPGTRWPHNQVAVFTNIDGIRSVMNDTFEVRVYAPEYLASTTASMAANSGLVGQWGERLNIEPARSVPYGDLRVLQDSQESLLRSQMNG